MNKHTPAPWLMNVKDKFCNGDFLFITDTNDRVICKVSHDLTELHIEEYSANARLIAAAPELLEALSKVKNVLETLSNNPCSPELMYVLNNAIQKATKP